ncbi:MAG: hypothetical protein OEY97_12980 [Nitrospirota bacterium]|nr:hypothetical protein [Nitrospirota bacterium]
MAYASRDRDREQLAQEIQEPGYQALLQRLQADEPFLRRFGGWAEVLAYMREGTSRDPRKDDILRPIFRAHREGGDARWRTVLLAIFWPGLSSIHRQKRTWDPDPEELWQNVLWTFLRVVCRIDTDRRPARLAQKVFYDTFHNLHEEYRRTWDRTNPERPWDDEIHALAVGHGIDFDRIALEELRAAELKTLRAYFRAGDISETDYLLLVGMRVYGESVADYARRARVGYEAAKKRRQRAETTLRRLGGEAMSPDSAQSPPLGL